MDGRSIAAPSTQAATNDLNHEDAMEMELARMEASLADLCVLPDRGLLALDAWLADEQELRDIAHLAEARAVPRYRVPTAPPLGGPRPLRNARRGQRRRQPSNVRG